MSEQTRRTWRGETELNGTDIYAILLLPYCLLYLLLCLRIRFSYSCLFVSFVDLVICVRRRFRYVGEGRGGRMYFFQDL